MNVVVDIVCCVCMAAVCIYQVRAAIRDAQHRREYTAIVDDVLAGKIKEAAVKSKAYLEKWQ